MIIIMMNDSSNNIKNISNSNNINYNSYDNNVLIIEIMIMVKHTKTND